MNRLFESSLLNHVAASSLRFDYTPLLTAKAQPEQKDLVVKDEKRSREIPIRVYLPTGQATAPVVVFSHGLGGNREGSAFLGKHWAARGYVAVFLQHPGSDDCVWKDKSLAQRRALLKQAATLENLLLRAQDIPAVLDQLEVWNMETAHAFAGRLDQKRIGMSGHSFGAATTQAVSGQTFPMGQHAGDLRIKAAVVMSPTRPLTGDTQQAFGAVKIPWLLLTGTKDTTIFNRTDAKSRLVVFPALPSGRKYELVLNKAKHSVFTERALPRETASCNPNHHRAILAVTTAFWDAYLRDDTEARKWLDGETVRSVLEKDDQWRKK